MPVLKPYTFVAGTPARAAEVNANFDTLYTEVNSLESQMSEYSAQLAELENSKANLNGSYLNRFSVANAVTDYDAVNKQYLMSAIGNSLPYIYGLGLTIAGNNTITVGAGQCYDSTYTQILLLSSNTSKQNTTQAGGTTYYVYIIGKTQGSAIDILISSQSAEPTLPQDYVFYRRIGYYKTDSSNKINSVVNQQINQASSGSNFISQNGTAIKNLAIPNYSKAWNIGTSYTVTTYGWIFVQVRGYSGGRYQIQFNGKTLVNETSDAGLCSSSGLFRVKPGYTFWCQGNSGGGPYFIPDA